MPSLSHINGRYEVDKVQGQDIVTSDVFRVDPSKLVSEKNAKLLEKLYKTEGMDWRIEITNMYQNILQEIHEQFQERFSVLKNDKTARFRAGLANIGLYGGHTSRAPQDFSEVHKSIFGLNDRSIQEKMICSEFVAKSTIAAFVELNERLGVKLDKNNIKRTSEELIRIPISKQERLHRIHPERLVMLLYKAGCITKIGRNEVVNALISQKRLREKEKNQGLVKNLYNKMNELASQSESRDQFVEDGKKIFEVYIKSEKNVDLSIAWEEMRQYLDQPLRNFHQEYDKRHPETFVGKFIQMLMRLAEWLGIRHNKAEAIIRDSIKCIEAVFDTKKTNQTLTPMREAYCLGANVVSGYHSVMSHPRGSEKLRKK